jgi:hypothetical protein
VSYLPGFLDKNGCRAIVVFVVAILLGDGE